MPYRPARVLWPAGDNEAELIPAGPNSHRQITSRYAGIGLSPAIPAGEQDIRSIAPEQNSEMRHAYRRLTLTRQSAVA